MKYIFFIILSMPILSYAQVNDNLYSGSSGRQTSEMNYWGKYG